MLPILLSRFPANAVGNVNIPTALAANVGLRLNAIGIASVCPSDCSFLLKPTFTFEIDFCRCMGHEYPCFPGTESQGRIGQGKQLG